MLASGRFAEMQESPYLTPKLGEIAILVESQIIFHEYIVSRYKLRPGLHQAEGALTS